MRGIIIIVMVSVGGEGCVMSIMIMNQLERQWALCLMKGVNKGSPICQIAISKDLSFSNKCLLGFDIPSVLCIRRWRWRLRERTCGGYRRYRSMGMTIDAESGIGKLRKRCRL